MLKLKLQYFGHLMRSWLIGKDHDAGRDWGQEEKGTTEDKMAGWHHWLDRHGFGWTLGVGDGQGGLQFCNSWGRKESDTTEWLNWAENSFGRMEETGDTGFFREEELDGRKLGEKRNIFTVLSFVPWVTNQWLYCLVKKRKSMSWAWGVFKLWWHCCLPVLLSLLPVDKQMESWRNK